MGVNKCFLNPVIIARVRNESNVEVQFGIEDIAVGLAIAVHEISRVRDLEALTAEQPLIDFHLALVAIVPVLIELGNFFSLGRGFIIHDNVFAIGILPEVVDRTENQEVGLLVQTLNAREVVPPLVQVLVGDY